MADGQRRRCCAIVPAFNEEGSIADVVGGLLASDWDIDVLVIDDGSVDETARRARDAGATVCSLPCNMGIGVAVQTGFVHAKSRGYEVAFQFDGDGQHLASELGSILTPVLDGEADVVIGSRFLGEKTYRPPLLRRIGIVILRALVSGVCRARVTDVTSGFRACNSRAIGFLASHYPTQYPEPESIVWLVRHGFRVREAPVAMQERQHGRSSIGSVRSLWYMMRVGLGILITGLRPNVTWKE